MKKVARIEIGPEGVTQRSPVVPSASERRQDKAASRAGRQRGTGTFEVHAGNCAELLQPTIKTLLKDERLVTLL